MDNEIKIVNIRQVKTPGGGGYIKITVKIPVSLHEAITRMQKTRAKTFTEMVIKLLWSGIYVERGLYQNYEDK